MQPHSIDTKAPIRKAKAVYKPYAVRKMITMNITATIIKQIKYSCFRNSIDP